ncbi:hypothetical protein EPI10_016854 [Gossypium australe]|uniref:Uncharacterized protein n=1 Tax=Gossypium australe TaxID=47621 RepID=A0A5B6VQ47_9ROSI|nr:hypothetical protein EPI10_016854 [Gossypium australe]
MFELQKSHPFASILTPMRGRGVVWITLGFRFQSLEKVSRQGRMPCVLSSGLRDLEAIKRSLFSRLISWEAETLGEREILCGRLSLQGFRAIVGGRGLAPPEVWHLIASRPRGLAPQWVGPTDDIMGLTPVIWYHTMGWPHHLIRDFGHQ